jgi:L-ascorbate metabolism protein UlaG (beta-lactamase superfamily)
MRRWVLAALAAVALGVLGVAPISGGDAPAKPITISYHGQSFYILKSSKGTRIAFDPHLIPEYGRTEGLEADIICISHNHNDHTRVDALQNGRDKKVRILTGLKTPSLKADWNIMEEKIGDVTIKTVGVYHDDAEGLMRGKNAVFIVEVDGWRVVHLGDLGHLLTPAQVKRIGPVDVLMIPVGGIYTLNGAEAKKVADQLKPKEYIFPMHYGTKVFDATLTADEFLESWEKRHVATSDDNVLKLNRDAQRPRPLVVHLHYWPKDKK